MKCPDCGSHMNLILAEESKVGAPYYRCWRWPFCRGNHSCHPNGNPTGFPVPYRVRKLRHEVHKLLNEIWDWDNLKERKKMYNWLKSNTSNGHIGKLTEEELLDVKKRISQQFCLEYD